MGHVRSIEPGRITLEGGTRDIDGSALYIDCSADGFAHSEPPTVFTGDHIALQAVRTCQPAFSAARHRATSKRPTPTTTPETRTAAQFLTPRYPLDWLRMMLAFNKNQLRWFADPDMMAWVDAARLNVLHHVPAAVSRAGAGEDHLAC